jgi:hypothetical protein
MRHFNMHNLYEISDAKPGTRAAVAPDDAETLSELSRHRFHLIDMSGELWILRRAQ